MQGRAYFENTLELMLDVSLELGATFFFSIFLMIKNYHDEISGGLETNSFGLEISPQLERVGAVASLLGTCLRFGNAIYKDLEIVLGDFQPEIREIQEKVQARVQDYLGNAKRRGWLGFFSREGAVLTASAAMVLADSVCSLKGS